MIIYLLPLNTIYNSRNSWFPTSGAFRSVILSSLWLFPHGALPYKANLPIRCILSWIIFLKAAHFQKQHIAVQEAGRLWATSSGIWGQSGRVSAAPGEAAWDMRTGLGECHLLQILHISSHMLHTSSQFYPLLLHSRLFEKRILLIMICPYFP